MSTLIAPSLRVATAACAVCLAVALCVTLAGERETARAQLGFGFPSAPRQLGEAAAIGVHNARYGAAVLLASLAVGWTPALRPLLDAALAALLGFNAGAIGLSLGAYGTRLLEAIVLHGTLELAAFALAGGAYLRARRGALGPCALLGAGAASLVLLATAALVEAWVAPGAAA